MTEKIIYSQKAPGKSNSFIRVLMFTLLLVVFCVLLFASSFVPYSGIVTMAVIFLFAFCTYSLMKNTVFDITYVLYEDKLVFNRRYGKIEMENEIFMLKDSKFTKSDITCGKKTYPFYPDEKMCELLGL